LIKTSRVVAENRRDVPSDELFVAGVARCCLGLDEIRLSRQLVEQRVQNVDAA